MFLVKESKTKTSHEMELSPFPYYVRGKLAQCAGHLYNEIVEGPSPMARYCIGRFLQVLLWQAWRQEWSRIFNKAICLLTGFTKMIELFVVILKHFKVFKVLASELNKPPSIPLVLRPQVKPNSPNCLA